MMRALLLCLGLCFALPVFSQAQRYNWEGGFFIGAANYEGDVVVPQLFKPNESQLAYGLLLRRQLHTNWAVRLNAFTGSISGNDLNFSDDEWRPLRGFNFTSPIHEVSLVAEWEPFGHKRYNSKDGFKRIISPYLFTGVGLALFDPDPDFSQNTLDFLVQGIRVDQTTDYSTTKLSIPVGAGAKVDLNQRLSLGVEAGFRTAFTDYLDGISQSADPSDNDWYIFGGATLTAKFGIKDSDKDGIADYEDACPTVKGVKALAGCPDADGDLVSDKEDQCPNVPGSRLLAGCPDTDKDGITDALDACPQVPGLKERKGCPIIDTDKDGVEDAEDECPTVAGLASRKGCPLLDTDQDGIYDENDKCPEQAGLRKFGGCPDTDSDGIVDSLDKCPEDPGLSGSDGCPEVITATTGVEDFQPQNIYFATNNANAGNVAKSTLDEIVAFMLKNKAYNLRISGHTDSYGNKYVNQRLSERRARYCFDYLVAKGVNTDRIKYRGYGEDKPVADNSTADGKKLNRRVEFQIYKSGKSK